MGRRGRWYHPLLCSVWCSIFTARSSDVLKTQVASCCMRKHHEPSSCVTHCSNACHDSIRSAGKEFVVAWVIIERSGGIVIRFYLVDYRLNSFVPVGRQAALLSVRGFVTRVYVPLVVMYGPLATRHFVFTNRRDSHRSLC